MGGEGVGTSNVDMFDEMRVHINVTHVFVVTKLPKFRQDAGYTR